MFILLEKTAVCYDLDSVSWLAQRQIGTVLVPICLFPVICLADFPSLPSGHTRSNSILGQKWVKDDFVITNINLAAYLDNFNHIRYNNVSC